MKVFKICALFSALCAVISFSAFGQSIGNPVAGQQKGATCFGCHGADGQSVAPNFPKLAGQQYDQLVKQLRDFRSSGRKDALMSYFSGSLTDQDIADLSAYFTALPTKPEKSADGTLVRRGQVLFQVGNAPAGVVGCVVCHGRNGEGMSAAATLSGGIPAIGRQHSAYLRNQLRSFSAAQRSNDLHGLMRTLSAKLSDDEIDAVAAYSSTLERNAADTGYQHLLYPVELNLRVVELGALNQLKGDPVRNSVVLVRTPNTPTRVELELSFEADGCWEYGERDVWRDPFANPAPAPSPNPSGGRWEKETYCTAISPEGETLMVLRTITLDFRKAAPAVGNEVYRLYLRQPEWKAKHLELRIEPIIGKGATIRIRSR